MDFRHLIVTCLFSKLRLPFDNQKVKENYAIFLFKIKSFSKKTASFFKKMASFLKNVLIFFATAGTSTSDIFHKAPNRQIM